MPHPRGLQKALLRYLDDVQLEFGAMAPLVAGDVDTDSTLDWSVEIALKIFPESREDDGVDWARVDGASLDEPIVDENGAVRLTVFKMEGLTVDTYSVADLADTLDARSADMEFFSPLVDASTGELIEGFGVGPNLVIVDRVRLADAWRCAGGVGRLLIASALRWLTLDAALIAAHPHPYTLSDHPETHPQFEQALAAVRRTWAALGFEPLPGHPDLYVVDPQMNGLSRAERALRQKLLGRA